MSTEQEVIRDISREPTAGPRASNAARSHLQNVTTSREREPGDRLPGESTAAYNAFCVYRDMESDERSTAGAYRLSQGKPNARYAPGLWTGWCRVWHWRERAWEWDAQRDRARRVKHAKDIESMTDRQIGIARVMQSKIVQRLQMFQEADLRKMTPFDLARWLELAVKIERTAMGVPNEVRRDEHSGPGGGPIRTADEEDEYRPGGIDQGRVAEIIHLMDRIRDRDAGDTDPVAQDGS